MVPRRWVARGSSGAAVSCEGCRCDSELQARRFLFWKCGAVIFLLLWGCAGGVLCGVPCASVSVAWAVVRRAPSRGGAPRGEGKAAKGTPYRPRAWSRLQPLLHCLSLCPHLSLLHCSTIRPHLYYAPQGDLPLVPFALIHASSLIFCLCDLFPGGDLDSG